MAKRSRVNRRRGAIFASVLIMLGAAFSAEAQNVSATDFEYDDGNLVDNTDYDWESAPNLAVGVDPSGKTDNSYKGGAKHDSMCPEASTGSIPPNKDDLTRFYVAHELINDEVFLYISWQRYLAKESSASAHMGFEFNQSTTPCAAATKSANVQRTPGDILVVYDLEGSGNPVLSLLTWLEDPADSGLCEASGSTPCWGDKTNLSSAGYAGGAINTVSVIDPIPDPDVTLPYKHQFGEAAVNLTGAGVFGDECEHFGSALLGSRSSGNSFTSTLKDFVGPEPVEITNCGSLKIIKEDGAGDPLGDASFAVYADDGDEAYEPSDGEPAGDDDLIGTCTTTSDGTGDCEFEDLKFGDYWVVETAAPDGYTGDYDPRLVTIDSTTQVEVTFTNTLAPGEILVSKVTDDDAPLAGAVFTLYEDDTPVGEFGDEDTSTGRTCTTDAVGSCKENLGESDESNGFQNVDPGDYCVVETTTPDGYATADPQCVTVSVGSSEGEGDSDSLTFTDVQLHKIIVIVCHQATGKLAKSAVSFGDDDLNTLAEGAVDNEQRLCRLDGFTDVEHGDADLTVSVGSAAHD